VYRVGFRAGDIQQFDVFRTPKISILSSSFSRKRERVIARSGVGVENRFFV
jgi:hypothetical protein